MSMPNVHYPVDYEQDHFSLAPPYHFQEEAVEPADSNVVGHRAWVVNLRRVEGYRLYQDWTSDSFPRMLMVTFLHPTPYFDDSYAVNSANNGPYGDAIMTELIPYIESHFRIIRAAVCTRAVRRIHRRMGVAGAPGLSSRVLRRRVGLLSRSDRFPPVGA